MLSDWQSAARTGDSVCCAAAAMRSREITSVDLVDLSTCCTSLPVMRWCAVVTALTLSSGPGNRLESLRRRARESLESMTQESQKVKPVESAGTTGNIYGQACLCNTTMKMECAIN